MLQKIKSLLFQNLTTRQTVAKNTFWLAVSNIGGRLIRAIIIIYAARVLGAAEWGLFAFAVSVAAFMTVFSDLGISAILVKETAKLRDDPERQKEILSAALFVRSAMLLVGIVIIAFIAPQLTTNATVKILLPIVAFILAFDTIREFCFSLIKAMEKMEWEVGFFFLTNIAIVVFGFIFLAISPTVVSFTYAYAAGTAIGAASAAYKLRDSFRGIFSHFSTRLAKYVIYSGWPFALSGILGVLMIDTDVILVGWLRSAEDVGLLSSAQRIVQLFYLLPSVLAVSLLPTFSRLAHQEYERFKAGLENALWLTYLLAIPLSFGGVVLGKEIIALLFGTEYIGGAIPFQILIFTLLINFPAAILANVIFVHGKQKHLAIYAAIGGLTNVALDILFIPRYGIIGSAIVTFIAQLASNAYLWHIARSVIKPSVLPRLKRVIPAAIAMSVFAFGLNTLSVPVLLNIATSILFYFGMLLALREPIIREIRLVLASRNSTPA
ncbi:MAG: flippase [Patescibacteria group bacterium]